MTPSTYHRSGTSLADALAVVVERLRGVGDLAAPVVLHADFLVSTGYDDPAEQDARMAVVDRLTEALLPDEVAATMVNLYGTRVEMTETPGGADINVFTGVESPHAARLREDRDRAARRAGGQA
jgi:hypothetical protein